MRLYSGLQLNSVFQFVWSFLFEGGGGGLWIACHRTMGSTVKIKDSQSRSICWIRIGSLVAI